MHDWLPKFVAESNYIEGINDTRAVEIAAHKAILACPPEIETLESLVEACAPSHRLRDQPGINVKVGNHTPPAGGPEIRGRLKEVLFQAKERLFTPFEIHCRYGHIHPFTDGNGRSGRALWLWMMLRGSDQEIRMAKELGFLHAFYYQSLGDFQEK